MDDDQQFCLRWNNHQSTLISVFDTLLENGTLVDCTLAAEGKFLKAHKVVLSACSPYFAALLSQQYDKHPIFILKDVKFQELRAMMDYMYRGEVNISQDQLAALLKAAESLQIKGLSDNRSNSVPNKADNLVKPPPPVPAGPKGGLTISDAKRKQLLGGDLDTDLSTVTREGSTSPSRKRKKIGRRRSIDANNVLDNHEQHSNSSSHSHTTPHIAAAGAIAANAGNVTNNIATSTPIVLPVTKKTDHDQNKTADAAGIDSAAEHVDDHHHEQANNARKDGKRNTAGDETHSELMIEPKNEYDDDEDDEGNEPVEDLTLDDEDMMDDMDQAGPSHGGEGSSSGYGNWPMERSQDEGFMGQDGGQPRDAQEIRPISTKKQQPKLVERSANVSITPLGQLAVAKLPVQAPTVVAATPTSIIPVKKVSHPRIKYSKLVNPSAQLQQTTSQNVIEAAPQQVTLQQQQQQQFFITRKILPVQAAIQTTPVAATQTTPRVVTTSNTLPTQILKVFTDFDGNSVATLPTSTSQAGQSSSSDFPVGIVDDLDYTGIDDIELPDDVHFSDTFKATSFKTHDQSNNSISSNSNDPTVLHTDKYTIFHDGSKFDPNQIHLSENSMSDADDAKQYSCQHCGKRYRWKSTLRRHENVECGGKEASHQCPYCPYKAKQRGNLGVHVRKHHSNLPPLLTRRNKKAMMGGQLSSDDFGMTSNKSF
ncbi:longitudinals lacking protein, isoforms F/I/K/T-like isoform X2 [Culicoides brevitarsis]|uniref:longitudinals lacking protein, isoforms F/I/K/T-like isoform X2 n=1 Tax=Culicoides brevitarsis TaxID=469753 RepID=UPI00307BDDC6